MPMDKFINRALNHEENYSTDLENTFSKIIVEWERFKGFISFLKITFIQLRKD